MKKSSPSNLRFSTGARVCASFASTLGLPSVESYFNGGPCPPLDFLDAVPRETTETVADFRWWYLRMEAFSKYPFPFPGVDRKAAAFEKFHDSERACATTNGRLYDYRERPGLPGGVIRKARGILRGILGKFEMNELYGSCNFGPGASTSLKRHDSCKQNKWVRSSHITAAAIPYYWAFRRLSRLEALPSTLTVVAGNRVTTVPKNGRTDRCIAIEPDWNMFFQKGLGAMIRRRLQRKLGLLTPDAQERNKLKAMHGSQTGKYCTIDLSAASDSLALFAFHCLSPDDWAKVTYDLRSPIGTTPDRSINYEKVSSMGNGATFEWETAIFYSLVRAVCLEGDVLVYGDDIICPTKYAEEALRILQLFGFDANLKKTFFKGPFRESCGGHYWYGEDVTPLYIRKPISTFGTAAALHNQMMEWSIRQTGKARGFFPAQDLLWRSSPKKLRGPLPVGGCFWSDWDEAVPKWNRDTQSYEQCVVTRVHKYSDLSSHDGGYLYKLWEDSPDLEASVHASPLTKEKFGHVFLDRSGWPRLPA